MSKHQLGGDYPEATEKLDRGVLSFFSAAERILLVIISLLTMLAVALELTSFFDAGRIRLADLLLLFIYLEVIGMAYAYYATHSVPVTLPVLIAITGITRLIILQGKRPSPASCCSRRVPYCYWRWHWRFSAGPPRERHPSSRVTIRTPDALPQPSMMAWRRFPGATIAP